ncbi:hypothetical protein [Shivajiella indica]|uniref:Class IIb bacteriocin, lactobin A/cerein 7B family n=1 Tax=Shivajiella indica TaxID=872115 RepID=A0ABW5B6U6_9BACT
MKKMGNKLICKELNSSELTNLNGGAIFVPALIWAGKIAAGAVISYFTYETVDGIVRGVSGTDCGCSK